MERHHIAVLPWNASGHVNPMLELSRRLLHLGFKISFLLPEGNCASVLMSKSRLQDSQHIQLVSMKISSDPILMLDPDQMIHHVATVLKALKPTVKCLVSDSFMGWSQDVANKLKIPRVAVWCSNSITEALCYYLPLLASKGCYPLKDPYKSSPITFLPGFPPLQPYHLPFVFRQADPYTPCVSAALHRMKEALCVLTNGVEELEQEIVTARRTPKFCEYLPVGPLIPEALMRDEPADVEPDPTPCELEIREWLDGRSPCSVLYIAFGTLVTFPVQHTEKIAEALEASGEPFLWAIRCDFVKDAPDKYLQVLQKRFLHQGLVVEWAPQGAVLKHPSIGAFLSHCGWNSTLEAICAGVPMLCWPCAYEQNTICFAVVEQWKIGLKVAEGTEDITELAANTIEMAIREVMRGEHGSAMRAQVQILKATARNSCESGCSAKNLVKLKELVLKKRLN